MRWHATRVHSAQRTECDVHMSLLTSPRLHAVAHERRHACACMYLSLSLSLSLSLFLSLSLTLHIYIHTYIWPHGLTRFEESCARADGKICKSVGRARGPIDAGGWQSFAHGAWCSRGSAGETMVLRFVGQSRVTRRRPRTRPTVCGVACHQYVMCECTHLQSWGAPARWSRAWGT